MPEKGWIKLHRKVLDCWIWQDKPYDKARAWVDLLLLAMHRDKKLLIDGEILVVGRGSFMTSISKLSERWGWSRNKTKRYLEILENEEMLNTKRTPKGTLVTIVKYEEYQLADTTQGSTESTTKGSIDSITDSTTDGATEGSQNKNIKNIKNVKNVKNNIFVPPTVQEVKEYCLSVGSKVDAESFVSFYESKGWMIGKNKMKSWKSAIVTWEKRNNLKRVEPKQIIVMKTAEEPVIDLWSD